MLRALSGCVLMVVPMGAMAQDHAGHAEHAGYVELDDREIKALSAERVGALRDGEAAGYALAAELNRYPGPRHALDRGAGSGYPVRSPGGPSQDHAAPHR